MVRVGREARNGVGDLVTTERYKAVIEVLSKPIGDFQASRFFSFPGMVDTKSMAVLAEAIRTTVGRTGDEAAFVRRMLLSELVMSSDKMGNLTRIASRMALDLRPTQFKRRVGYYHASSPNGKVAAIDLTYFCHLMTRKAAIHVAAAETFSVDSLGFRNRHSANSH
ncbi:hypothetical protein MTO96_031411 [Rhipicephalus appendiculatus]